MNIVDFAAQALQFLAQRLFAGTGFLDLLAKIRVRFLEALAVRGEVAAGVAGEEAKGGREDDPDRYNCCCTIELCLFKCAAVAWVSRTALRSL